MTKKPTVKKKRNPQDATLRNVRATAKRLAALTARMTALEEYVKHLFPPDVWTPR